MPERSQNGNPADYPSEDIRLNAIHPLRFSDVTEKLTTQLLVRDLP